MPADKSIAVIILNFFASDDTVHCVNSVLSELWAEVFLVDNSVDETETENLMVLFGDNSAVKIFFPQENLGFAAGVNFGLREAQRAGYKKFLVLNNDTVLMQGSGPILTDALERYPSSLISPTINWNGKRLGGMYYHRYLGLISSTGVSFNWGWFYYLTGCALAFDESLLERAGYFDESFFMYGEDVEFCYRVIKSGCELVTLSQQLVFHAGSKSSRQGSLFYEYQVLRGHFLLTFKFCGSPLKCLISFSGKSLTLFVRALKRSLCYRSPVPLLAWFLAPFSMKVRCRI